MDSQNKVLSPAALGALAALLAGVLFGLLNVTIRLSEPSLTIWHMMFGRSVTGVVLILIMARRMRTVLIRGQAAALALIGLTGTLGILGLTHALLEIPLFQALVLFYTYPAVAALTSPWLTKDTHDLKDWGFIGLAFAGICCILWSGSAGRLGLTAGHLSALSASLGLGLTMTLIRRVRPKVSSLSPIFAISVVGSVICVLPLFHSGVGFRVSSHGLLWILIIGILAASAHIATNKALGYISSSKVGIFSSTEVLYGALIGLFLFSEPLGWSTLIGGALILAASIGLMRETPGSAIPQPECRQASGK